MQRNDEETGKLIPCVMQCAQPLLVNQWPADSQVKIEMECTQEVGP